LHSRAQALAGNDFFTVEVLTLRGLDYYYVLLFIHHESRRYFIHKHDTKLTDSFRAILAQTESSSLRPEVVVWIKNACSIVHGTTIDRGTAAKRGADHCPPV